MTDLETKLCGIAGEDNEGLTVGRFNKWFAIYVRLHVAPTHEKMTKIRDAQIAEHSRFEAFMVVDKEAHARIDGGITFLKWVIPGAAALFSVVIALSLYIYHSELKAMATDIVEIKAQVKVGVLPVTKERLDRAQEAIRENKQRIERLERK